MKNSYVLLLFLFFSLLCNSQTRKNHKQLCGEYHGGFRGNLTLLEDSTFYFNSCIDPDYHDNHYQGVYAISHDTLVLRSIHLQSYNYVDEALGYLHVERGERVNFAGLSCDSLYKIICYDKKLYLYSLNKFPKAVNPYVAFCELINYGSMGRGMGSERALYRPIRREAGYEKYKLPERWKDFILKHPLVCNITSSQDTLMIIDKGYADGLRVGMYLQYCVFTVVSVTEHMATVSCNLSIARNYRSETDIQTQFPFTKESPIIW